MAKNANFGYAKQKQVTYSDSYGTVFIDDNDYEEQQNNVIGVTSLSPQTDLRVKTDEISKQVRILKQLSVIRTGFPQIQLVLRISLKEVPRACHLLPPPLPPPHPSTSTTSSTTLFLLSIYTVSSTEAQKKTLSTNSPQAQTSITALTFGPSP